VRVYVARLVCSDPGCAAELDAEALTQQELETLICDCGCGLEIVGWADWVQGPGGEVVHLRLRGAALRDAA
jgi:hypothetical protein